MNLRYMFPASAVAYVPNGPRGNAEHLSNGGRGEDPGFIMCPDLNHLIDRQDSPPVALSARSHTFICPIGHVVLVGSFEHVGTVTAPPMVSSRAVVADQKRVRIFAMMKKVSDAVGAVRLMVNPKNSVPVVVDVELPRPAFIWPKFLYILPKSGDIGFGKVKRPTLVILVSGHLISLTDLLLQAAAMFLAQRRPLSILQQEIS